MKLSATAVLTVFLLSSCTQQVSSRNKENSPNTQTVKKETTMEQVRNRCRRMLHKVESRDDLIKQMYETAFKDDCLYVMHAEELKEIWKIPVTDSYPEMPKYLDIESPIGMYVVIEHTSYKTNIYISMTKKYREKKEVFFLRITFLLFFLFLKRMKCQIPIIRTRSLWIEKKVIQLKNGFIIIGEKMVGR